MNWAFQRRPCRVLVHAEFRHHTGFGQVSENIVDRLHEAKTDWGTKKFEIAVMALGQGVNPYDNDHGKPYRIIPMYGDRRANPFGQDYAKDVIEKFRPDVVITFGDTWMIDFWNDPGKIPADLRKTFKLIGYVAIDGYPVPEFWIEKYTHFDKLITFTEFGKQAIEERAKLMGVDLNVDAIYHGVNPQLFKPLPAAQVDQFKKQRGMDGKKIVGMFSRNQPRKHHPEFVEFATALLKATNNDPDIRFYFHTVQRDAGWDLPGLIKDVDLLRPRDRFQAEKTFGPGQEIPESIATLKDRFIFPGINNPAQGYPIPMLNMMYNICDAHVLLTSGEGWGCSITESMSAGIPTFTNDYAAGAEQIRDSGGGEVIKAREFTYRGSDHNFYRPHTDYEDAIAKVLPVLNDPEVKKKYSKRARAYGLSMSWDIIVDDWVEAIDSVFDYNVSKERKAEVL